MDLFLFGFLILLSLGLLVVGFLFKNKLFVLSGGVVMVLLGFFTVGAQVTYFVPVNSTVTHSSDYSLFNNDTATCINCSPLIEGGGVEVDPFWSSNFSGVYTNLTDLWINASLQQDSAGLFSSNYSRWLTGGCGAGLHYAGVGVDGNFTCILDSSTPETDPKLAANYSVWRTGGCGVGYHYSSVESNGNFTCVADVVLGAEAFVRANENRQSQSTTILSYVPGLYMNLNSLTIYEYDCNVVFSTNFSTTGIALALNANVSFLNISYTAQIPFAADAAAAMWNGWGSASNDTIVGTGVQTANVLYTARLFGLIHTNVNPLNLSVMFRSETVNRTLVTPYSYCRYKAIG